MPLFQEATERKILVEMLKESIKPAPDIITNPDEIPCIYYLNCKLRTRQKTTAGNIRL